MGLSSIKHNAGKKTSQKISSHPTEVRLALSFNALCPTGNVTRLAEMLQDVIEAGDETLIFTPSAEIGSIILRRHLEETFGREVLWRHGQTPKAQRDRVVDRFQSCGGDQPRLFVLYRKAGGTGLNLTAANHVFHFDRWWNPAVENQATERAFRIGQKQNVQVHKFICVGTIEDIIETERQIAGSIVGTGEDWLNKLSTPEIKDLLALRDEALPGQAIINARAHILCVLLKKADSRNLSSIFQRSGSNNASQWPAHRDNSRCHDEKFIHVEVREKQR
jgi:SNF2 family DNA or RNA helicase